MTRSAALLFTVAATSACRAVQCLPPEPSASVVAEQASIGSPRVVEGRVLNVDAAPLVQARVRLREAEHGVLGEDRLLARKVVVEGGLTDLDAAADLIDRGAVLAALSIQRERGVDDLLA